MKSTVKDEALIRCYLLTQSADCLATLYQRHAKKVYSKCLSMTHDLEKSRDFTHDIFLKVIEKLPAYEYRASFSSWIYSITHNYCIDQIQRASRLRTTTFTTEKDWALADLNEALSYEEFIQALTGALTCLSQSDQLLLRLKYEQGLSLQQLADRYGLKVTVIKMRLKRSRTRAQRLYAQQQRGN